MKVLNFFSNLLAGVLIAIAAFLAIGGFSVLFSLLSLYAVGRYGPALWIRRANVMLQIMTEAVTQVSVSKVDIFKTLIVNISIKEEPESDDDDEETEESDEEEGEGCVVARPRA